MFNRLTYNNLVIFALENYRLSYMKIAIFNSIIEKENIQIMI